MNFEFAFWSNNAIYLSVFYLMLIKRSNCDLDVDVNGYDEEIVSTGDSSPNHSVLNVAENEDAAKTIAKFLSADNAKTRNGISHHNKIYEFQHNLQGRKRNMIMTSVSGHLLAFAFSGMYKGWTSCTPESLFEAPLTKVCPTDYEHVYVKHTLETEIRFCDTLIIWTDCDREGENIGFDIASVCTAANHNITVHRALFSEITAKSVQYAMDNLGKLNKRVSDAEDVRSQIDLRTGAAFTRFQTLRLQQAFPKLLRENVLSYGTLQFPTLGIVVERYLDIKNFKTEPTWKIEVTHADNDSKVIFSWERTEVFDYETCRILHRHCRKVGEAKVERIKLAFVHRKRPQPLDTLELQKSASEKLKLTAKTVMDAAEKLYFKGFISYPRSAGNIFPEDTDLECLVQMQTHNKHWGKFASRVLENVPDPREGIKSDRFYPPIHPVKYTDSLTGIEAVVYEFIVRHFLASVSEDAIGNETTVIIDMDGERFYATGLSIVEHNYLDVYPYDQWPTSDIRNYKQGQKFVPTTLNIVTKENAPPKHLTEATLIQLMKDNGIGITDATYGETIDKIKSRLYISLQNGKNIVPAPLGMGLIEGYNSMGMGIHLSEPQLRAELEADLQRISKGDKDPKVVLVGQLEEYRKQYRIAQRHASKLDIALSHYLPHKPVSVQEEKKVAIYSPVMKCPKCGSDIILKVRPNNTGYYLGCLGFPSCKTSMWFPSNVVKLKVQTTSCSICGPQVKKLKFEFKPGSMRPFYPDTYVGCVNCDLKLLALLNVRPISTIVKTTPRTESSEQQSSLSIRGVEEDNSQGDQMFCKCGLPAVLRTVRKEGKNKGRQFYVCQKPWEQQCKFLEWADNTPARGGSPATNYQSKSSRTSMLTTATDEGIRCKCGLPAVRLTVKKEGRNKGKIFYKCSKPRNQQCDFIEWGDKKRTGDAGQTRNQFSYSATAKFAKRTATDPRSESNRQKELSSAINNQNYETSDNICCHCGLPAKKLTVKKEGRNKGKIFYACPKPQYQQCGFIEWGDNKRPGDASRAHQQSPYSATARFTKGTASDTRSESNREKYFSSASNNQHDEASDSVICCDCGLPAKKAVVVRPSRNKGREFYVCPNRKGQQCKFYQWADEISSGTGPRQANYKNIQEQPQYKTKSSFDDRKGSDSRSDNQLKLFSQYTSRSNQNSESSDDEKLCDCGLPAKKLTVVKESPNKGKQFYVCAQPINQKCKFYKWAKEKSSVSSVTKTSRTKGYKTTTASSGNSRVVSEELDFLNDIRFPSSVFDK